MKYSLTRTVSALAVVLASSVAQASLVFDGGDPNGYDGYFADASYVISSAATTFSLSGSVTANQISWWGAYSAQAGNGSNDQFTLSIFDGSSIIPGYLIASYNLGTGNRVATGGFVDGAAEYAYKAAFADLNLGAGLYFAALTSSNPTGQAWRWETTSYGSQMGGASYSGGSWSPYADANLAFKLNYSPVPIPAAIWLFGSALAGLTGVGYQRRKLLAA